MSNNNQCENKCKFKSKIGGQALIEGVMMRGIDKEAMAVRLPNGEIDVEVWDLKKPSVFRKIPLVRGTINFVISLADGYKCLMKSADKSMQDDEEEEMTKFEKWLFEKYGDKIMNIVSVVALVLGILIAVALFFFVPTFIAKGISNFIDNKLLLSAIEGVIKITLFVVYIWLTGKIPDIHRQYEYHGAEHKTIACYEAGLELTVENVKKQTRFHPRCGTSFIFIVLFVGIFVFSLVTWSSGLTRALIRIALMPVVIGIAYELIRLAGRYDNLFTKIISAPGLYIQRLTTHEPDDKVIEVAIAAMTPVIPEDKEVDRW